MSDYIYMLESHLSPEQNRVVALVQEAAGRAGANLFLTGGAMRDILAGFRVRDLDFAVEGQGLKLAKALAESGGAQVVSVDEARKSAELLFPGEVTTQVATARQEKYTRAGAKPQIWPATIQEDLRGRDFTCNAIALSLNRASRGLLLDPTNGLADVERRELRTVSSYAFYHDPSRLLRLVRLRARLGFSVEERTLNQAANAREAAVEKAIPARVLGDELKRLSTEDRPLETVKGLQEARLLTLFCPALAGPKLNLAGMAKFEKAIRLLPEDGRSRAARFGPFLSVLVENLTPGEKQALIKATEMSREDAALWQKLETRARKLETALRAPRVRKPSQVYEIVSGAAPDEVLFLLYRSPLKAVQERLRNYFQTYLPAVQAITAEEWASVDGTPGARHSKARAEFIRIRLDRRPKEPEPTPADIEPTAGRRAGGVTEPSRRG